MDAGTAVRAVGHGAKVLVVRHHFDEAARVVPHHLDAREPARDLLQLRSRRLVVTGQIFDGPLPSEAAVHGVGGGFDLRRGFRWWR